MVRDRSTITAKGSSTLGTDRRSRPTFRKFLERSPNRPALSTSKTTRYVRLRYVRLVSALPLPLARKSPDSERHQPRRGPPTWFHRVVWFQPKRHCLAVFSPSHPVRLHSWTEFPGVV